MVNNNTEFSINENLEELDNIMITDVINNPVKYIKTIFGSWPVKTPYDIVDMGNYWLKLLLNQTYKIKAEEEFHGIFPDIIIEVTAYYSHILKMDYRDYEDSREYSISCKTCNKEAIGGYRNAQLLTISKDQILDLIKKSSEQDADRTLLNMAWKKAEEHGYKLKNDHDDLYYWQMDKNPECIECFNWKYHIFIEVRSYIKSIRDILRQLKSKNSIGEKYSYSEPLNESDSLRSAEYQYNKGQNLTFKGTFLLTPDLRFRNEFESQGIKVIPFNLDDVKDDFTNIDFNQIKKYYKYNEKNDKHDY